MSITITREKTPRILIVDDEPAFVIQTQECLEKKGYEVIVARNGKDALAYADKGDIDVILLDIIMPVLNGVEVCKILRRNPQTVDIPIIVISTMTEYKDRVEFFRIGANDYMPKPIDNGELIARVDLQLSLQRLRSQVELANAQLTQKNRLLEQHVARIEHDLSVARNVQRALLPDFEKQFFDVNVCYRYMSSDNLASDFFDYVEDDRGNLHVIIADVSGHGIASALLASQLKVLFVTLTKEEMAPRQFMAQINQLSVELMTEGYYFTAIYLQYNPRQKYVTLVNGGHVPLLLLERANGKVKQVESNNSPLGFFSGEKFYEVKLNVGNGDRILMFTDGVTEHTNENGQMFDLSRVIEVLKHSDHTRPTELVAQIIKKARDFGAVPVFKDDVTVGVLAFETTATADYDVEIVKG